jgi:hypothetical protein
MKWYFIAYRSLLKPDILLSIYNRRRRQPQVFLFLIHQRVQPRLLFLPQGVRACTDDYQPLENAKYAVIAPRRLCVVKALR